MTVLRIVMCVLMALCFAGAVASALVGAVGPAIIGAVWGTLLLIGVVFERWRYKPISGAPFGPGWSVTDERFVDPATGKPVTVYFNAATGERRYVDR